jgi:hypothetical protein
MEIKYATNKKGNAALTTGIIGTALGALNSSGGMLGGLFGGGNNCCSSEDHLVNRYDAAQQARIAELETEVKFRDANIYSDSKLLEMYRYFDGELKGVRDTLCAQAIHNQRTEDSFALARQDIAAVESRLSEKIKIEAERRCCGDNSIINYANATFYPKLVADVTAGTTTTAQTLYNPLPKCGCGCDS